MLRISAVVADRAAAWAVVVREFVVAGLGGGLGHRPRLSDDELGQALEHLVEDGLIGCGG